jgi:hypothetical protein
MKKIVTLTALLLASAFLPAQVKVTQDADHVQVEIDGKPFTTFYLHEGEAMKPYLYPLRTADGKIITRHFPMEKVDGEPTDHPHQRGLWFGHEDVNGSDFWNNETSETYVRTRPKRGWIKVDKITEAKGGKTGVIGAEMTWSSLDGTKLLSEKRVMTFSGDAKVRTIDIDITLTALTAVKFGDAKDGVLGIRLARSMQEDSADRGKNDNMAHTGTMVNAEGLEKEKNVWSKLSNWVDYSGDVDGAKVGVAIFDNPQNSTRSVWHSRGYGLFAANPFGRLAFNTAASKEYTQDGSVSLDAGKSLHYRFRVVIHNGDAKDAGIAKMWDQYVK